MRVGSLCTGIYGLDLAVEAHFGAELAWYSEIEPAPITVIEREHPDVPNLGDLKLIDWSAVEPVDILTAGYPCQPFSTSGKRQGASDVRHLWPFVAEAVRVLRPRWVVLENVAGHLTMGFGDVLGDLAEAGFDAEWCVLRASDVGAPHQRKRLFVLAANAAHVGHERSRSTRRRRLGPSDRGHSAPDAHGNGACGGPQVQDRRLFSRDGAADCDLATDWGAYASAVARWESIVGSAPRPVDERGRLSPAFVEWMMGYPEGWVDGLTRTQALKALGNAVVPQQALAALSELAPIAEAAA